MNGSSRLRAPAVAGRFYPASPQARRDQVSSFIEQATPTCEGIPKAIIAPHAGYAYSGAIAGSAYGALKQHAAHWDRVVLIGPSHFVGFTGIAVPSADAFATPLGTVQVDRAGVDRAMQMKGVHELDAAHEREHGLEVHLPFLQVMLDSLPIVPLVTSDCDAALVQRVLDVLCRERTLLVISSDLSHYHDYDTTRDMDRATASAIESLNPSAIASDQACGQRAIQGLLLLAQARRWQMQTLDLRNSGDTAGSRDRVVGYGAWVAT